MIWYSLLLLLNWLDYETTERLLAAGGKEMNPLVVWLMEHEAWDATKLLAVPIVIGLSYSRFGTPMPTPYKVVTVLLAGVVLNNAFWLQVAS